MIGLKNSYEIAYNGTENECRFELYADTAADLQGLTHFDGIKIQMGSECTDIATGDKYILNGSGVWILQPSQNAFSNVYTKSEINGMVSEINEIMEYYHGVLISDTGEITFYTFGGNVGKVSVYGNGQQTGTPTPKEPIMPTFCGTLDGTDWKIPITCTGQTTPLYLGEVSTVRRVRKLVLTGTETFAATTASTHYRCRTTLVPKATTQSTIAVLSTHYYASAGARDGTITLTSDGGSVYFTDDTNAVTDETFKSYLAAQYAAGTPVTVWYVLAEPTTGIVNEPLCKIGDYADELSSEDAAVTIPTVRGQNILTVETQLPPSKIVISGE